MSLVSRGKQAINERYRPCRFSEVIGNDGNKAGLARWMQSGDSRSKTLLLSGASGCGKTTMARILAMGLNCERGDSVEPCLECPSCRSALGGNAFHIVEKNMASDTGKDDAEEIVASMGDSCLTGRNKVYILDECQRMSVASQNLFLKPAEKPPKNVYVIFCTTDPDKIIPTLRTRCERYPFLLPKDGEIAELLRGVMETEGYSLTDRQKVDFFSAVKGRPYREILFAFEQYVSGATLESLSFSKDGAKGDVYQIAQNLLYKGNFRYYKNLLDSGVNLEYEGIRNMLRSLCGKEIEKAGLDDMAKAARYYEILRLIDERKFFDANNRPSASALFWRICAEVLDAQQGGRK